MLVADRAHVPLWELAARGKVWTEMYRVAAIAEQRAQAEITRKANKKPRGRGR